MKRPLATAGISLLIFEIIFILTNSAYGFAGFCLCVLFCISTLTVKYRKYSFIAFTITFSYILAFLLFGLKVNCEITPSKQLCGTSCYIEGKAADFCTSNSASCTLKNCTVNGIKTNTDISVYFGQDFSCSPGDTVGSNVYIYNDNDYELWELYGSPVLRGNAYGEYTIISPEHRSPVYYAKLSAKKLSALIDSNAEDTTAAITKALLLGDKSELSEKFTLNLRKSGASHIFAVSGMHLSLWSAVIFLVLRSRSRTKIIPNLGAALFVLFYMALTGFSVSVLRAGIMLITVYLGYCFRRPADALNSLGLSALILICINPLTAVDVSFLLSFTATASLFILYPNFEIRFSLRKENIAGKLKRRGISALNTIILSLCVLFFTTPVSGGFFGTISLLSPVSSLLCTLPAEGIMLTSAIGLLCSPVKKISAIIFSLTDLLSDLITTIINRLSQHDFAVCRVDIKILLIWYSVTALVTITVYLLTKHKKLYSTTALLLCGVFIFPIGFISNIRESNKTYIHIFDAESEGTFIVHTALGGESVLVCNSDDTDFIYSLTDYMQRQVIDDINQMVFTGGYTTDSEIQEKTLDELFSVNSVIPVENTAVEGFFSGTTEQGIDYEYQTMSKRKLGIFIKNDIKIVYCFYYSADFSSIDEKYHSGDILICHNDIPKQLKAENFKNIIVISDKNAEKLRLPENAISTADTGEVSIEINAKGDVYAVY